MTRIFLVRHGQSEWNAQGRWQGQSDPHLSDRGREEAAIAASAMRGFDGIVFSSPLLRARETAEIIAATATHKSVLVEPGLSEIDVGDFSGLTNEEIEERFPDEWTALRAGKLTVFPGGESRAHQLERVLAALHGMARRHAETDVLAVSHGGSIAAVERNLGVHPGVGVGNLVGRWFSVGETTIEADGDRVALGDQPS